MNSITKRWVRGSLLVTILMCLVAEAVFLYYSITNYYDGARRAMTTRTSTIITQLNASAAQTGESQGVLLRRMVEQFTEKDKFELMLVNAAGKPLVTSTGFAPDDSVAGEDYLEALASEKGEGHAVYRTAMGEKVMAVTTLLPRAAGEIVAVRQPDGEIFTEVSPIRTHPWQKWPFVRGIFNFIDSLVSGYKCLMKSAEVSMGEDADLEETKFDKWVAEKFGDKGTNFIMAVAAVLGGVLALVLFMVVPTALAGLLARFVPLGGWRALIEGVFKLVMLVGYMALVSRMKEIARMFRYHGAEHKTIACYESVSYTHLTLPTN